MINLINTETRLEAWIKATKFLLNEKKYLNLILHIEKPNIEPSRAAEIRNVVDNFLIQEDQYPLFTVAETIFPGWEYNHKGAEGVFEDYPAKIFPNIKNRWGTYAYRMLRRNQKDGTQINPLKILVEKMKLEAGREKGSLRSCYELGISEGEYDMPLFNTVNDKGYRMGAPCLSHLSFKLWDGEVHLTAIYRSHCYRWKVLGNLLGLARLQQFVADQTALEVGALIIHSTYAYLDEKGSKRSLIKLHEDIENLERIEKDEVA